ncbi:MAG: RES family NAD+ phosphorylase [Actinomycetota bacterium]|nr:RES family NAD+ phosphorylase [Actinomycetota bacterium]
MLYRSFARDDSAKDHEPGGALFVPRWNQGAGRHDNPYEYGTLYASRSPESAVAEYLQHFRGHSVSSADLKFADGRVLSLAAIADDRIPSLPDLDDPEELLAQHLRPSRVATRNREMTQSIALELFGTGSEGFSWWSTIEAAWINVTLFAERAIERLTLAAEPEALTLTHPAVVQAAGELGIPLG